MKHLLFGILLLTLSACHRSSGSQGMIPQDSMVPILVDIHVADGIADQKFGQDKNDKAFVNAMYERIFQNHHVTSADYKRSYKYYESQPAMMDKMYEQVITELSKKEAEMKKAK